MTTIEDLAARVARLEAGGTSMGTQCKADNPHPNMMYDGRYYRCPCGKIYAKQSQPPGTLIEMVL